MNTLFCAKNCARHGNSIHSTCIPPTCPKWAQRQVIEGKGARQDCHDCWTQKCLMWPRPKITKTSASLVPMGNLPTQQDTAQVQNEVG